MVESANNAEVLLGGMTGIILGLLISLFIIPGNLLGLVLLIEDGIECLLEVLGKLFDAKIFPHQGNCVHSHARQVYDDICFIHGGGVGGPNEFRNPYRDIFRNDKGCFIVGQMNSFLFLIAILTKTERILGDSDFVETVF
ncbi:MAG: hypothetical protein U9R66_13085 [Thermodesulfobacteriota bacterium]|nr:hypothetical protein [Thermodesulfobacteriota bacterium]